jgi:phosphopantothenate synthetase
MGVRGGAARQLLALIAISGGVVLWGCSGIHLRPESYDWVAGEQTAPAAVREAKAAIAEAHAAGAANVSTARYPMAKAREYILLAEDQLSDRDLAAAEITAGIAKKAAEEAKAIAQRRQ